MKHLLIFLLFSTGLSFAAIEEPVLLDVEFEGQHKNEKSAFGDEVLIVNGDHGWKKIGEQSGRTLWAKLSGKEKSTINLDFKFVKKDKNDQEVIISSPKIKTTIGEKVTLEVKDIAENEKAKLKVVVNTF